jgi:hypothetical protein
MFNITTLKKRRLIIFFIFIGLGIFGNEFIKQFSVVSTPQFEPQNKQTAEEITIRLMIMNEKSKVPIPNVKVDLERPGVPIPPDYTDNAGYVDITIPKTEYIKVRLSKPGFEDYIQRVDPNLKYKNTTFYMKELFSSVPDVKESPLPTPARSEVRSSSSQQENLDSKVVNIRSHSSQQVKGFQFDFPNCTQDGNILVCKTKITALDKDSILRMSNGSSTRIIDDFGNEYLANGPSQIGSQSSYSPIDSALIKSIPMNASITFKKIPQEVNKIAVLEISFYKDSDKWFKVRFDNIAVTK